MKTTIQLLLILLSGYLSSSFSADLDVPFVPTPYEVVNEMLNIANVNSNDTLYDLGCGDGRIVITAVSERGVKKGVGVDLDPQRIKECRSNASQAGISDRVNFIQGNLFDVNFNDATVLTMYLLPDVNLKLRSKIFHSLEPGSRVVSHDFDMGSWRPNKEQIIGNSTVFFWIIPANASGSWTWSIPGNKTNQFIVNINQRFQDVTAKAKLNNREIPITNILLNGSFLTLTLEDNSAQGEITFSGTVTANQIKGTYNLNTQSKPWTALRNPSSIQNIAPEESLLGVE